jgi:hypothetical protein
MGLLLVLVLYLLYELLVLQGSPSCCRSATDMVGLQRFIQAILFSAAAVSACSCVLSNLSSVCCCGAACPLKP